MSRQHLPTSSPGIPRLQPGEDVNLPTLALLCWAAYLLATDAI